jgi:hypothetical protein
MEQRIQSRLEKVQAELDAVRAEQLWLDQHANSKADQRRMVALCRKHVKLEALIEEIKYGSAQ